MVLVGGGKFYTRKMPCAESRHSSIRTLHEDSEGTGPARGQIAMFVTYAAKFFLRDGRFVGVDKIFLHKLAG